MTPGAPSAPGRRGTDPEAIVVVDHLRRLSAALTGRGLRVRVDAREAVLTATGPVGGTLEDGSGLGLSQSVRLVVHDDGSLHWYWAWPYRAGDDRPRMEYMAPARDHDLAAAHVAKVLDLGAVRGR